MAEIISKVKNFSKSKLSYSTPHLLTMQKETWDDFWNVRVKELLEEISPIRDYTGKEFELWFGGYNRSATNYKNGLEAKKNNDSLEESLRVKIKLVNLKTKEVKEQEVYFADFPAMTERGTFVLDGIEKVEKAFKDVDNGEIQYIKETLKRDTCKDQKEALVEVYRRLRPGDLVTPDTAQDLIFNMFFNFDRYDLSKVGRW